jgi:hypothetical protein
MCKPLCRSTSCLDPLYSLNSIIFPTCSQNEPSQANLTIQLSRDVDLGALKVDSLKFLSIPYRGIYFTNLSPLGSATHFRSRVFFPSVGILEDHVSRSFALTLPFSQLITLSSCTRSVDQPIPDLDRIGSKS